jgi:hypothetical protein
MGEAGERQQVVLADDAERDRAGQHQLVVPLIVGEGGQPQRPGVEQFRVRAGHPGRGLPHFLAVDVDAQRGQEIGRGPAGRVDIDAGDGPRDQHR